KGHLLKGKAPPPDPMAGEERQLKKALESIRSGGDCKAMVPLRSAPARPPRLEPDTRVQFLPGVGPVRSRDFERLGLLTAEDLVRHYPRSYLDARRFVRIADLPPHELVTVTGTVKSAAALRTRVGRTDFVAAIGDGTGILSCYFYGQPFLARVLSRGAKVVVSGELDPIEQRMF